MRLIIGNIYQGRHDYAYREYGRDIRIIDDIHSRVEEYVDSKSIRETYDIIEAAKDISSKALSYDVCIANECYGGLTQIDERDRLVAKLYGQVLIELSKEAESVERIVCSLSMRLK